MYRGKRVEGPKKNTIEVDQYLRDRWRWSCYVRQKKQNFNNFFVKREKGKEKLTKHETMDKMSTRKMPFSCSLQSTCLAHMSKNKKLLKKE